MTKIELNGNTFEFDRIVAYGCSMTAGAESVDHTIHKDYDTIEKTNKLKREVGQLGFHNYLVSQKNLSENKLNLKFLTEQNTFSWDLFNEEQKKQSWIKHLADKFGVSWYNRAWSGGSFLSFQYFCEEDIFNNRINDNDLIIVGLTSCPRWFYLSDHGFPNHPLYGFFNSSWPNKEVYNTMMLNFGTNYTTQLWHMYSVVRYFKQLPYNVIFIPTLIPLDGYLRHYPCEDNIFPKQGIRNFVTWDNVLDIDMFDIEHFNWDGNDFMCGNHPSPTQLEQFASKVYERLSNG